jgi:hypothetical protein
MTERGEFTPGPWHLSRSRVLVYASNKTEDDHVVAEVYAPNGWDRAYADARLIAAAPDLLAALRNLLALWDAEDDPADVERDVLEPARAAIAKAMVEELRTPASKFADPSGKSFYAYNADLRDRAATRIESLREENERLRAVNEDFVDRMNRLHDTNQELRRQLLQQPPEQPRRCQGCEDAPLGQHTGPHDWLQQPPEQPEVSHD